MVAKFNQRVGVMLFGIALLLGQAVRPIGAEAAGLITLLQTNKGCGATAVFQQGEATRFFFRVAQTSTATMTIHRPDLGTTSTVFSNAVLQGGVTYFVDGVAGTPGPRTLRLTATTHFGGVTETEICTYSVGGVSPGPGPVIALLTTNKGCGAGATFVQGEGTRFLFRVNTTSTATLTITRDTGTTTVFSNAVLQGGVTYFVDGVAGTPGLRTLTLTATAGGQTTQATCTYSVVGTTPTPTPIITQLTTNKGCGVSAAFVPGEGTRFLFRVNVTSTATMTITRPGMGTSTVFSNVVLQGGVTYFVDGVAGTAGPRTLTLTVQAGGQTDTETCEYTVTPLVTAQ